MSVPVSEKEREAHLAPQSPLPAQTPSSFRLEECIGLVLTDAPGVRDRESARDHLEHWW